MENLKTTFSTPQSVSRISLSEAHSKYPKRFSVGGGDSALTKGHLAMLRDTFSCHGWGQGWWREKMLSAPSGYKPGIHGTALTVKNHPAPNVYSTEGEKRD